MGVLKVDNEVNFRGSDEDEVMVNCSVYGFFIGGMVDWLGFVSNVLIDGDGLDGLCVYVIDFIYNFGDVYYQYGGCLLGKVWLNSIGKIILLVYVYVISYFDNFSDLLDGI